MEVQTPAIKLTERAAAQVRQLMTQEGLGDGALRIKVVGGGCSGYSYDMFLDDESKEGDIVSVTHGVKVVSDEMSLTFMEGTEVDYVETLTNAGFKFNNPKAEDTCGCGISFKA